MAKTNTRLELTWIGKENRPKLEPRILIKDPAKSYQAAHRASENDLFDNRLIFLATTLSSKRWNRSSLERSSASTLTLPTNRLGLYTLWRYKIVRTSATVQRQ